jgi:uncharacterized protein YjiS (DUF1127 family)
MTTAMFDTSRPSVSANVNSRSLAAFFAPLSRSVRDYRTYHNTLAALRQLSARQLEDLGFAGLRLEQIARKATYGR